MQHATKASMIGFDALMRGRFGASPTTPALV